MKQHIFYPAIFEPNGQGDFGISFPDLPGCISMGSSIEESLNNARESLGFHISSMLADGDELPEPSSPDAIDLSDYEHGAFQTFIELYMPPLMDKQANRAVAKNVTLPYWLKKAAEDRGINFSQILVSALKEELGVYVK